MEALRTGSRYDIGNENPVSYTHLDVYKRQIKGSMDFAAMLLDAQKVAVVPGAPFGAEGYCRLSYATSLSNIEKGISRIAAFTRMLMD